MWLGQPSALERRSATMKISVLMSVVEVSVVALLFSCVRNFEMSFFLGGVFCFEWREFFSRMVRGW